MLSGAPSFILFGAGRCRKPAHPSSDLMDQIGSVQSTARRITEILFSDGIKGADSITETREKFTEGSQGSISGGGIGMLNGVPR